MGPLLIFSFMCTKSTYEALQGGMPLFSFFLQIKANFDWHFWPEPEDGIQDLA